MTENNQLAVRIQLKNKPKPAKTEHWEVLWGRVIAASAGVVLAVGGGLWWWLGPKPEAPIAPAEKAEIAKAEIAKAEVAVARLTEAPAPNALEPTTPAPELEAASAEPVTHNPSLEPVDPPAQHQDASAQERVFKQAQPSAEVNPAVDQSASTPAMVAAPALAPVTILQPSVQSAVLSAEQTKRKPGAPLPKVVAMHGDDLITVYFFTEYQNLQGQWVYHDWYRQGKRMARVKARPHETNMQAYSSKYIDRYMVGDWQVKVTTQQGQVLATAEFSVVL